MEFGTVMQPLPPIWNVVELARKSELAGFSHFWTFDSHLIWQEPNVIFSQVLANTHRIKVGPMVTNPKTRDATVTASTFATLNTMFGNRTVCGIGRGDSAVRVLNGKPARMAELAEAVTVIKDLGNGRPTQYKGSTFVLPWSGDTQLPVYVGAYGPKMLALTGQIADGLILQIADLHIVEWAIGRVRTAAQEAGRDPDEIKIIVAAPAYVGDDLPHQIDQCRWFGAMVGNHVADIVKRYGKESGAPEELTSYIANRTGYDYNEHGKAGNAAAEFVPDAIVERFCILGQPEDHIAKLRKLKDLGVDQFAVYLQHDAKEETLLNYGKSIIPAIVEYAKTKS
ncbi:MAG: TIGR03842 family LLM class F420-dependent oxidoreductase [Actinomycetes bacterium]